jgi:hypothetical protein
MVGPIRATVQFEGFVELAELSRLFGVDPATIRRRLRAQGRSTYNYPIDRRLRLVAEEDVRAIFQLVPAQKRARDDAASEG